MKFGAVALIIFHFIAAIVAFYDWITNPIIEWAFTFPYDWISVIVNALIFISAWSAFSTNKKCWATICAVFLFISAIYYVFLTTMVIMSGVKNTNIFFYYRVATKKTTKSKRM